MFIINIINRYQLGNIKSKEIKVGDKLLIIDSKDNTLGIKIGEIIEVFDTQPCVDDECTNCYTNHKQAFRFINNKDSSLRYSCWYRFIKL